MQGRKCLFLAAALIFAGCSPNSIMKPDCHSCTVEDQEWNAFAWAELGGQWRGSLQTFKSAAGTAKKERQEKAVAMRFFRAEEFLRAQGAASCGGLSPEAVVMNGQLWGEGATKEFETFVPVEDDKVAYGRLSFEKVNGQQICRFRRIGAVMGQNRLALPAVAFSEGRKASGRGLASLATDTEYSVEFLRFDPVASGVKDFKKDGRGPASVAKQEKPQLILRVFKVSSREGGERGAWNGSEELLYRLWKAE